MPNKNAVKKPRKKTPAKSRANSAKTAKTNKTDETKARLHENPIAVYALQFIMGLVAVYILVSFILHSPDDIGGIGVFIRNLFYGLFGGAAFLVPFFLGSIAFFLRRDSESGFFKYRMIFSVTCLILYASILQLSALSSEESAEIGFSAQLMFESGAASDGGGVLGGFFSRILMVSVGSIGAWLFILPLSFIFSIFLFGRTPLDLLRATVQLIKEYKDAQADKKGFEREIVVKDDKKFKPKKHTYRISSSVQNVQAAQSKRRVKPTPAPSVDIQAEDFNDNLDNPDNFAEDFDTENIGVTDSNKKKRLIDINPFANNKSDNDENIKERRENIEPVMIPNEEIFENEIFENDNDGINDDIDDDNIEFVKIKDDAGAAQEPDIDFAELENLQVLDSAPQAREDEPELVNDINFETSQIFENEEIPKKEYKIPPISYLTKDTNVANEDYSEELRTTAEKLITTLASFNVKTKVYGYSRGPSITRYEIAPESGTKARAIANLVDDISLNLATGGVRIETPIPGKPAVGVEVPNKTVSTVHLRTLLEEPQFTNAASSITVALGMDVAGNPIYSDIAKMPHLLIAGATGMGKSVCINSIITSILYKANPNEVKLILVDPKKVELSIYDGIPHLLVPVVSEPKKAAGSLAWAVNEMENRYMLIQEKGVRDLKTYNEVIANDPLSEPLPQIVIVIDELADLIMTAPADVEQSVSRITAKARAAGIHLIIGTQRPSVDVITGLIKANIPSRIAFTVASQTDSRVIIDSVGAEKLIGRGDMLYSPNGSLKPMRVQGAFVSEKDVLNVVEFWKKQSDGEYDESILSEIEQEAARTNTKGAKMKDRDDDIDAGDELKKDPMLKNAIEVAIDTGRISVSLLQTKLEIGYNRAARIVHTMEKMNIIGQSEGSNKPRKILITREDFIEMTMNQDL